jgi:hypothetical protein
MAAVNDSSLSNSPEDRSTMPGPEPIPTREVITSRHRGVVKTGLDGEEGEKAFYIHIEARPGKENEVEKMLADILDVVNEEATTGPWFGFRYSQTAFGIVEMFANIAGRDIHTRGGGGDIFRDLDQLNDILAYPAHIYRLDVLLSKKSFAQMG